MLRAFRFVFLVAFLVAAISYTATPPDPFSLSAAGVATPQAGTLIVAAPLINLTEQYCAGCNWGISNANKQTKNRSARTGVR